MDNKEQTKTLIPTRKWVAARIVALAGIATMWATTSGWDVEETIALIALLSEAGTSYLLPNLNTPGGVPTKTVAGD